MHLRRLARTPLVYWAALFALAALTGITVNGLVSDAHAERARFGRLRPVAVATRPLEPGGTVESADVAVRELPAALLPDGPVSPTGVVGRTVAVPVLPGEPVLRAHLAPDGVAGVAALLPPGAQAVAVPAGANRVPVARGDVVDVLASLDPADTGGREPTFPVATAALVVDVAPEAVSVAVSPEEARRVAFAASRGAVSLALRSPVEPR